MMQKIRSNDKFFLSIAATDTTGEAGVIKDCKIASCFGFNTLATVTALTIQDDTGLKKIYPLEDNLLREQLQICLGYPLQSIKIGAITGIKQAAIIAEFLGNLSNVFIVWDPVFSPTHGESFIKKSDITDIVSILMPFVDIVTPNYQELYSILSMETGDIEELILLTQEISQKHNTAFFITGGHQLTEREHIEELLVDDSQVFYLKKEKKILRYQHGTGCTLSTALACLYQVDNNLYSACENSTSFVSKIYE